MKDLFESYEKKRAEAIREYKFLCRRLLTRYYTVYQVSRAYSLKKQYNL